MAVVESGMFVLHGGRAMNDRKSSCGNAFEQLAAVVIKGQNPGVTGTGMIPGGYLVGGSAQKGMDEDPLQTGPGISFGFNKLQQVAASPGSIGEFIEAMFQSFGDLGIAG